MIAWLVFTLLSGLASIVSLAFFIADRFGLVPLIVTTLLSGVGVIGALRSSVLRSPVFCTQTGIRLELSDVAGKTATLTKKQQFAPLWEHITRFDETVNFDGKLEDFKAEVAGVASNTWQSGTHPGSARYSQEFNRSLRPLRRYSRTVSYRYVDSYTQNHEFYFVEVLYPGVSLSVEILFPASRPPTDVTAYRVSGGIRGFLKELSLEESDSSSFKAIRFRALMANVGSTYRIEWTW